MEISNSLLLRNQSHLDLENYCSARVYTIQNLKASMTIAIQQQIVMVCIPDKENVHYNVGISKELLKVKNKNEYSIQLKVSGNRRKKKKK